MNNPISTLLKKKYSPDVSLPVRPPAEDRSTSRIGVDVGKEAENAFVSVVSAIWGAGFVNANDRVNRRSTHEVLGRCTSVLALRLKKTEELWDAAPAPRVLISPIRRR